MSTTLAEQNQDLLNAGLIDQNAALTATGSRLLERSETAGEDPDEMLDFYLKGWIDADLNLTQDGNIWEGVMERGLEDILSEPNQEKGFQLYQQAKNNGALSYYKTQAGEEYEDMVQFLEHAAKNFAPMAGQLFGELVKVPGGLAQTYEVAQRSLPWYFQTPAGWLLGAIKGKPTEEELAANKVRIDAYAKEALLRMPATMSYGAHAALTHHPVTGKLFTDEDRLRSAYLYRKAQYDIEQVETGTAIAAAIDFGATMATTVADVATLGLQSEELEELIEDFREKNIYGDEGVEAQIKSAEQQLNELDRIEGNDPDLPWYQRPSQTKTRAEIAKETGTAVGMILSPDTLTPFAFAALGRSAVTATMRKSMQLSGELVELQGKRQLLQSSQKAAAASPFGKGAASQLQRQIDNIDGTIAATEKRLLRVSQAIEPRLLSAVGAMGRKIRSVPFKASGAALQSAGTLLKRMNPALSGLTQGAAFYGLTGGNPFVGALGVIAGMTGQGGRTFALGQRLSKVGLEWGKRRTALPFFRKLADESKDSVFRRQLFLAGDFALGKPVRMTRQFADYYRRAFIAEVPFSYIAAGGASYAGGNWLTDAMAEALAFEAPMAMGANVTGSLMGMKTAGTVEEQNRLATNAALNFRDEFLRDPEKRAVFDALPPVAKRALGNYHTAFPDLHWDFDVSVANGSSYYDSDSNTIRINPNDPRGAEAAMAHEFRHYLDAQGFEQGVVDELVGPSGILRLKDGSYMPSFVTWANNENKLRGDKWDLSRNDSSDWAEAALEWSAYSSMDGLASSVRHNALIKATQRHPWMRSLMDAIMPASYRQKSLMNMGLLFDSDGTVSVRKGLPGRDAYKQQAAIAKRVQRYMRDRAGIGATDADRADLHDPEKSKKDPNAILPNDQEGLNQVESVMTPDLEHDAQGNVILKNGEAQLIPQEIADARAGEGQPLFGPQIEQESNVSLPKVNVGRGTDNGTDLTGVAKMHGASPTGALVGAARLKEMLRSLPFSDYQLEMFDEIVDILSDPSRRGESLLSFYFPVWRKKRGKGNWRNFVPKKGIAGKWGRWAPYALVQSDEGNLLVYGISHDQVAENIAILAKSASGRKLYDGSVGRIASDFELMVTNWGKDIKNITQFTDEQLNFLNAIFGNVGKGNPDFNPALLEAPFKKLRSAVRSYRLDRFARIQTLPRDPFPFALEKGRRRELPFEEQAMEGQTASDADYLAAVEAGDTDAAQRMVDDAAAKAGMVKAAHGMVGELEGNTFDRGRVGSRSGASRGGFSFTTDTDAAKAYALSSNEEADVLWWAQKTNEILRAIPETSQAEVYGTSIKELEWDTGAMDIDEDALAQIPDDIRYIADAIREHEPEAAAKLDSLAKKSPPQDRKGKVLEVYLSLNNAQTVQASIGAFGQDLWGVKATSESDVIVETDNGEKVYYVYSPSNIKSADPVTYDDQKNVIPLSKRFDTGDDIRGEVGRPTTPVAQPGGRREMPLEQPDQHGMRSSLVENLSDKVQGKRASADQLKALIAPKKGLVNQEEVKWLGIDQLVDSMDKSFGGKIPVQEFFAEVRRRSEAGLVAVERSDRAVFEKRKATKADVLEARKETNEGPPAFESYVTHLEQGQEEYRETVLVSPNAQDWSVEQVHAYGNDLLDNKRIAASLAFVRPNEKNEYGLMIEEAQSDRHQHGYNNGYLDDQGGLGADELETLVNDTQAEIDEVGLQIEAATESHPFLEWQNANIGETEEAASMRLGEEAPEIDHLRNTDTGYVAPYHYPARSVWTLQRQNAEAPGSKIFKISWSKPGRKLPIYSEYQKQRGEYDKFIQPLMQRKKELHKKRRDLRRAIRDRERLTGDAPFRNPAAWYVALFKRGLQQAVNEDLEWIGWWEGKVANDRWGLVANDIERLVWDQRYLAVYRTNQPVRSVPAEDSERLTELLGPDLGEQLYQKGVDHWNNISERADELVVEEVASLAQERAQYEIDEEGADPDGFEERVLELVAEDFEYDVARDRAETMAESELGGGDITLEQDEIQKSDVDLTPYYDKHFVNGVNKYLKRLPAKLTQSKMPHPKFEEATARYFKVDITPELRKKIKEEGQTRW